MVSNMDLSLAERSRGMRKYFLVLGMMLLFGGNPTATADQFHYNNVILGDRAMGLGGAFCGVSDDASGIIYNTAGLAFALNNDISGSANAFYRKKVVYKETIGKDDFTERSRGGFAPFFGGLQKLDNILPGLVFAFGIYTSDSELKDQDDKIEAPDLGIVRFHRTVNLRSSTSGFAAAVAKRVTSTVALGLGLSYLTVEELVQEYQDAHTTFATSTGGTLIYQILTQNIRQRLTIDAIQPTLGVQWAATGRLSFGLHLKLPVVLSQSLENGQEVTRSYVDSGLSVPADTFRNGAATNVVKRDLVETESDKNTNPIGKYPQEARAGVAWFATTRFLYTFDLISTGKAEGDIALYKRGQVLNYATGAEYYITPSVPLRFGMFTNNDARLALEDGKRNQPDHIDYKGLSLFFAWVQPNSQISLGAVQQMGKGKAQKIANQTKMQDVVASSTTLAFSASHSF